MSDKKFKSKIKAEAGLQLSAETASRVLQLDASGNAQSSTVTTTELGYVSGLTSSVQTQLGDKVSKAGDSMTGNLAMGGNKVTGLAAPTTNGDALRYDQLGANSGIATLDGGGKVPVSQLPNSVMELQGAWNASTNSPTLADGAGNAGDIYEVTVAGTQDLGSGNITFIVGDWVVYGSSGVWYKSVNSNEVVSVNGQSGIVVLDTDDISEGTTNKYFSNELAQDAVGGILTDTATIDLTYNDGSNQITADVIQSALDHTLISNIGTNSHAAIDTHIADTSIHYSQASISITASQVSDFNEAAQDAVGAILTDTSSVDLTYNDGSNQITATVLPAGVDHNSLQNFSANKHIDHTTVSISTAADSGLTGGGDISSTRSLSVDIPGTTVLTTPDNADKILIYDNSATALKSITRANFLSGIPTSSAGDISETSFSGNNNQGVTADIVGLAFANGTVRSFSALMSVYVDATSSLYETFELLGIQKGSTWDMSVSSTGDDSGVVLSITNLGQVQYTSANYSGFNALTMKFRAITVSV